MSILVNTPAGTGNSSVVLTSSSDGAQVDAFSRIRTSQPLSLFNFQNLYVLDRVLTILIERGITCQM